MLVLGLYQEEVRNLSEKNNQHNTIHNLLNTTELLIKLGATSISVTLSLKGIGVLVIPNKAVVGCTTAFTTKIATRYLKKERSTVRKTLSEQSLNDFRIFLFNSLQDQKIDDCEWKMFITQFGIFKEEKTKLSDTNGKF